MPCPHTPYPRLPCELLCSVAPSSWAQTTAQHTLAWLRSRNTPLPPLEASRPALLLRFLTPQNTKRPSSPPHFFPLRCEYTLYTTPRRPRRSLARLRLLDCPCSSPPCSCSCSPRPYLSVCSLRAHASSSDAVTPGMRPFCPELLSRLFCLACCQSHLRLHLHCQLGLDAVPFELLTICTTSPPVQPCSPDPLVLTAPPLARASRRLYYRSRAFSIPSPSCLLSVLQLLSLFFLSFLVVLSLVRLLLFFFFLFFPGPSRLVVWSSGLSVIGSPSHRLSVHLRSITIFGVSRSGLLQSRASFSSHTPPPPPLGP